jgi:hypothetical protein
VTDEFDSPFQVPDAIEPIVAYRAWRCEVREGRPILHSVSERAEWDPGWMHAECLPRGPRSRRRPEADHEVPAEGCTCGVYALKELSPVMLPFAPPFRSVVPMPPFLVGKVQLAGKVIEHEDGYRAERARIAEILPTPGQEPLAELVAETYGAKVSEELIQNLPRLEAERAKAYGGRRVVLAGRRGWGMAGAGPLIAQIVLIGLARASGTYFVDHAAVGIALIVSLVGLWVVRMAFVPANLRRVWPIGRRRRGPSPKRGG